MSTVVLTNRLEPAQHTPARVAGFACLFNYVTSVFGVNSKVESLSGQRWIRIRVRELSITEYRSALRS
jgi:hypothetical protein